MMSLKFRECPVWSFFHFSAGIGIKLPRKLESFLGGGNAVVFSWDLPTQGITEREFGPLEEVAHCSADDALKALLELREGAAAGKLQGGPVSLDFSLLELMVPHDHPSNRMFFPLGFLGARV